jgi:hypothetical protein
MQSQKTSARPFRAALLALLLVLPAATVLRAQQFVELDPARVHQIAGMLAPQPSGFGVPCSDRAAWASKAAVLSPLIAQAEQALTTPVPPFDPEAYLAFTRTGDRAPMERNLHSRQDKFVPLVLAECVENKGRFIPRIAELMDSLAAMPSWTLSAHDGQLRNFNGTQYYVDLNAADMADTLAQALYLLGDKVPAETRKHVLAEMERHVFGPIRASYTKGGDTDSHSSGHWWLHGDMNWNAVCIKGVTGAALAVLPGVEDRAMFVAGAEHYIDHYDRSFAADGYDTEGLGYWNYGFSHFIELRENLIRATGGKIDLLQARNMKKVSLFGLEWPMMPGNSAAYGDAGVMPHADKHLVAVISHIFQIPSAEGSIALDNVSVQHVGLTSLALDLFPVAGDQLPTPAEITHPSLSTYYGDMGILVSRPAAGQNFAVTIKAGGNTTHSHNDIGSWVIGMGGVQPVGEPGGPLFYNANTFNSHRLEFKLMNSFGHPVPEIGGHLQLDATTVKVSVPAHSLSDAADSITIDMTNAYDAPELKNLKRTLVHSRAGAGSVTVTDAFELNKATEIVESLPTHGTWQKLDDKTVLFTLDGQKVRAVVDAPVPFTFAETKVDEYRNPFTRVEVHVPLPGSGKISITLTPEK